MSVLPAGRPEIAAIPTYSTASGLGHVRWKASSNECVLPPSPAVQTAITEAGAHANRYPSLTGEQLVTALAAGLGVDAEQVVVGGGSLALLQHALTAYTGPGTEVVHAWRSYEAYPILVTIAGARGVPVPLREHVHDVGAMLAAITDATRAVIVCNPNNPTGTELPAADLERLLDAVPDHVLVLLDEAYREFSTSRTDGLELAADRPNVAVLRTFSKAYGLAGLRAGYLVAHPEVAALVRSVAPPFGLSAVAEIAATAAWNDRAHTRRITTQVRTERDHLVRGLRARGLAVPPSESNFVWLPLGADARTLEQLCVYHGVSVRCFDGEGVRVTVGERPAADAVLAAVDSFLAEPAGRTAGEPTDRAGGAPAAERKGRPPAQM